MAKPTKIFYATECKIHGKQSDKWEGIRKVDGPFCSKQCVGKVHH